jgi:acyl-CoA dehydrogenase
MDFRLTEEEKLIRNTAAQFVDKELLSREGAYLKQREAFLPPGDPARRVLDPEIKKLLTERAMQAGLWNLEISDSEGDSPVTAIARVLIHAEFGRTLLPFEPACIPAVLRMSPHAKTLAEGTMTASLAFDQVHKSGSLGGIETHFRETPDGYWLSGTSVDVLNPAADVFLFPAKEEGTARAALFLLDRNTVGFSVAEEVELTTDETVARITLRECKIQSDQLLGYEYEIGEVIAAEQLRIAARSLGIGMRCLAGSIEHARNRVTFGRALAQRQAIQWMLADLSINLRTCTWLTLDAAWRADQSLPYFDAAALAKKRAAKMAFEAADTAIQIHGGYGVCKEFPFEGFYREARMMRLLYGREGEMDRAIGEKFLRG